MKIHLRLMLSAVVILQSTVAQQPVGAPPSQWDISGAGDTSIQGFTTDISTNVGGTVSFKVKTTATAWHLDIYRMGYYGGNGALKIASVNPSVAQPQSQPACLTDASTGLIDCGNWAVSATWTVPTTAKSGIYFAKAIRDAGATGASHIVFVVRDDSSHSDILFQTSDTTWQAYNQWGGNSLYVGSPAGRAYKVSYNRPFTTRGTSPEDWVFNAEYPMVRWLEANGYDVSYTSGVDTDRSGSLLLNHKIFMSVGHDEYWAGGQRANVEAARAAGVHLAFLSGNEVFWKTRWENSIDSSHTASRTLVCYKETHANAKIDPTPAWTGTWRDPRFSPPADGGRPENALTGTIFTVNCCTNGIAMTVSAADGKMRFWRNTNIATLAAGQVVNFGNTGILNYEWDEDLNNGFRPPGLTRLSSTPASSVSYLQDYGSTYSSGNATHSLTIYRHPSGALVFGAGTVQYSWALDNNHDRGSFAVDQRVQQATVNLLADMGVQPSLLQSGLILATQSNDVSPPLSTITFPASGATVPVGVTTITGTASDTGGVVASVEISTDGGSTWRRANGRESWTYDWSPSVSGPATVMSRAVDDTGNVQTAPATINVTVGGAATCPCSLWTLSAGPTSPEDPDTVATELGVKFRSDTPGFINAIRFYKGPANTGTHVGSLWSASGSRLAFVTFTGETASGWQTASLSSPVAISANTTYVVSYNAPNGRYSATTSFFTDSGVNSLPLHGLQSGVDGPNGVYAYGPAGTFPTLAWLDANYWVDVVFTTSSVDTTPPTISAVSATPSTTTAIITWTTNEPSTSRVDYGTSASTLTPTATDSNLVTAHNVSLSNLSPGTTYYFKVTSADAAGNSSTSPSSPANFITLTVDTTPPTISPITATPSANGATISWTTNEASTTRVDYGLSASTLDQNASSATLVTSHSINLTSLAPNTTYYFRVTSADAAGNSSTSPALANNPSSFTTLPPVTTVTSNIFGNTLPTTIDDSDTASVELGMKFRSDVAGTVTGVRFYKSANNTGVHTGSLWSSTGTLLATVTFSNETGSGWQQANFASPVNINAGTTYIVSYHALNGHYSGDTGYFTNTGVYNPPLYALRNGVDGANGVYLYGAGGFPNQTFSSSNYYVDVIFTAPATNSVRLFPAATVIQTGTLNAGTAAALAADDNTFYQVRSTTSGTRTAAWYGSFTGVPNTLTGLAVSYVGKNSATCTEALSVWNFTTSAWVQVNSSSVGTNEILRANLVPTGTLADYVSGTSGTGEVRVRVSCSASATFTSSGDLMTISYTAP